jgi:uncharacterized membrane protein
MCRFAHLIVIVISLGFLLFTSAHAAKKENKKSANLASEVLLERYN